VLAPQALLPVASATTAAAPAPANSRRVMVTMIGFRWPGSAIR